MVSVRAGKNVCAYGLVLYGKDSGQAGFWRGGCAHTDWYRRPPMFGGNMWYLLERVKSVCAHGLVLCEKDGGQVDFWRAGCAHTERYRCLAGICGAC